jgi:trigger factor
MEVTVESGAGLERRMRVQVPEEQVDSEVQKRLGDLSRQVRVPGFRPGKVPMKVIRQRYGRQVRGEVVGELVQSSFYDALVKEKLRPAGSPRIEPEDTEPGQGVTYLATFDIYPEVALPPLETLTISRPVAEVSDDDVETMIGTLQRQRRTWNEVERAATPSDRVVIDFQGFMDGEALDNAKADDFPMELDGGRMIPGFEDGLVGSTAGDVRTLDLTFPEAYQEPTLAGRPVKFEITVRRVEEPALPEIDDEFATSFGIPEGGAEALRREVRNNMERELAEGLRNTTKQRTMDALLVGQDIELPEALVEEECKRAMERRSLELSHSGIDAEQAGLEPSMFKEEAHTRVCLGLVLAEVIREHDIKPDPQRVRARIETIASTYEQPDEVINWYYGNRERLADIETSVLEEQVVDWVLERASVTEEATNFDALMRPATPA